MAKRFASKVARACNIRKSWREGGLAVVKVAQQLWEELFGTDIPLYFLFYLLRTNQLPLYSYSTSSTAVVAHDASPVCESRRLKPAASRRRPHCKYHPI